MEKWEKIMNGKCEKYMFGDKSTFGSEGMKHTLLPFVHFSI